MLQILYFGWGSIYPRPHWGAHSAPLDPVAGFKWPISTRWGGRENERREKGEERKEKGGGGGDRTGRGVGMGRVGRRKGGERKERREGKGGEGSEGKAEKMGGDVKE